MREHVLLFCLLGSGAHSHDRTGDRTGSRDLGAGPHRMSCPRRTPRLPGRLFLKPITAIRIGFARKEGDGLPREHCCSSSPRSPRAGLCHHRTAGIAGCARRRGGRVAARRACAAVEVAAGSVKIGKGLSGPQARLSFPFLQRVERR